MKILTRTIREILLVVIGLIGFIIFLLITIFFVRRGSMVPTIRIGDLVITGSAGGPLTGQLKKEALLHMSFAMVKKSRTG
jgi:hypothetical protein